MKEYGLYLCNMDENYDDLVFVSALCKSKRDLLRRLESMAECKKYKKWIAMVSCMLLSLVSVVPSYAASEGIISLNENWIDNTEVENEAEQIDFKSIEPNRTCCAITFLYFRCTVATVLFFFYNKLIFMKRKIPTEEDLCLPTQFLFP